MQELKSHPHRRYNPLTDEWVLVSPHRVARPWQGDENVVSQSVPAYDATCYLCPGNVRANGIKNPDYNAPFSFVNDYAALYHQAPFDFDDGILFAKSEEGTCKVLCYGPRHDLHMAYFDITQIVQIIDLWHHEYTELAADTAICHVQIFENRGVQMGASNPHPHGQIWAQHSIPHIAARKQRQQQQYYARTGGLLLHDYIQKEQRYDERIVYRNQHFVWVVPFWAVWPFETMIVPIAPQRTLADLSPAQKEGLADALQVAIRTYDGVFGCPFPYSMGLHLPPVEDDSQEGWQFHIGFYPPLLRSASVRKFMVGYELCAMPQRDITPEYAAHTLKKVCTQ